MDPRLRKGGEFFTFFSLYIAQKIPTSFFSTVIPVIMRQQNFSLEIIGLLQLLKLPWILKFIWSPVVDRTSRSVGDYKRWVFSSEMLYAVIVFAVAFLDLKVTPMLIIILVVMAFVASATQDIATDALAVLSFKGRDRAMVNGMQSLGNFAATALGSGVMLMLYNRLGWGTMLPMLAIFVLVAVVPLMFFRRGTAGQMAVTQPVPKPGLNDYAGFFRQKHIWKQIVFLFLYYAGITGTLAMIKPMLVDYGYSMGQIGIMMGIVGASIGGLASFVGGVITRRFGRYRARILFAAFMLVATAYFVLLMTALPVNIATLHLGITLIWASYGMAVVVVYTTAMDYVRKGYEGTDFTMQTVFTHLSGMVIAVGAGKLAGAAGYTVLFVVEMCIALVSLIYILTIFKNDGRDVLGRDIE